MFTTAVPKRWVSTLHWKNYFLNFNSNSNNQGSSCGQNVCVNVFPVCRRSSLLNPGSGRHEKEREFFRGVCAAPRPPPLCLSRCFSAAGSCSPSRCDRIKRAVQTALSFCVRCLLCKSTSFGGGVGGGWGGWGEGGVLPRKK